MSLVIADKNNCTLKCRESFAMFLYLTVVYHSLIIVLKLEVLTGPQPKIGEPTAVSEMISAGVRT